MNFHSNSQQPFALVFDFSALLVDNLNWNSCINTSFVYTHVILIFRKWDQWQCRTETYGYSLHCSELHAVIFFIFDLLEFWCYAKQTWIQYFSDFEAVKHKLYHGVANKSNDGHTAQQCNHAYFTARFIENEIKCGSENESKIRKMYYC